MFHNDYGEALDIYKRTIDEIHRIAANSKIKVYAGFEVDFFRLLNGGIPLRK